MHGLNLMNRYLYYRYLLVYKHNVASTRIRKNKFLQLVNDNRMVFLLIAYIGMLALIGKTIHNAMKQAGAELSQTQPKLRLRMRLNVFQKGRQIR